MAAKCGPDRWALCAAMNSNVDVFRNIRVIIAISRLWGLVPCTVGGKFKKAVHFVYSVAATCFFVYVCIAFNVFTYRRIGRAAANIKLLIKIVYVETTLRCVLLLAILLVNLIKCREFVRISAKFSNFDQLLRRKLHLQLPANENLAFQCVYAGYILFFGLYYGAQLYVGQNGVGLSAQWALLSNVYLIILAQFTILVRTFHTRFKLFNAFFANVNVLPVVRNDNRTYVDRLGHVAAFRGRNLNMLSQHNVKELHIIYLSMRDLLHEVNAYYSFQILSIVCETVAILIASLSNVTFNIMGEDFSSKASGHMLTLLHCAFRLLTITLMVHVAEGTAAEANHTVIIVHKFLKNEPNVAVRKGLKLFMLDLWHHRVKLNAHDFFDLDYQLIQSILSAATTYVIVLIQFQLAMSVTPGNKNKL